MAIQFSGNLCGPECEYLNVTDGTAKAPKGDVICGHFDVKLYVHKGEDPIATATPSPIRRCYLCRGLSEPDDNDKLYPSSPVVKA